MSRILLAYALILITVGMIVGYGLALAVNEAGQEQGSVQGPVEGVSPIPSQLVNASSSWDELRERIAGALEELEGLLPPYYGVEFYPVAMPVAVLEEARLLSGTVTYTVPSTYIAGNWQIEQVAEEDVSAFNGTHVFVLRRGILEVYRVYPPTLGIDLVAKVNVTRDVMAGLPRVEVNVLVGGEKAGSRVVQPRVAPLYVVLSGDKIVVVADVYYGLAPVGGDFYPEKTVLAVYNGGGVLEALLPLDGGLIGVRCTGSRLVAVTGMSSYVLEGESPIVVTPHVGGDVVPPESVLIVDDERPVSYINIVALDTSRLEYTAVSIVGDAGLARIVMTPDGNLYVSYVYYTAYSPSTTITAFAAHPQGIAVTGNVTLPGAVTSQWQLQPYDGYLLVIASRIGPGDSVGLYVLDGSSLEVVASVENIIEEQDVHGVRLIDGILYFVTYRMVDPLFAVNVTDPTNPELLGYLTAPGFDEYLHPVEGGLLLGIGYEDRMKLRVSLYRLEGAKPVPLDRIYLAGYTSPVLWEGGHRAFMYYPEKGLALFPVKMVKDGVAVVKVDTVDGKLALLGILDHPCATRIYIADDYAFTVAAGEDPYLVYVTGPSTTGAPYWETPCPPVVAWNLDTLEKVAEASTGTS